MAELWVARQSVEELALEVCDADCPALDCAKENVAERSVQTSSRDSIPINAVVLRERDFVDSEL